MRAPLQIYRALGVLIERTLVHRVESLNAFVACTRPTTDHGHTLVLAVCRQCKKTEELAEPPVRLGGWARRAGFKIDPAILEIHGLCADCRS